LNLGRGKDPGSEIRDPRSGIRDPGSEIRDPRSGIRTKNHPGSGSRILGVKRRRIPDPDPQHWIPVLDSWLQNCQNYRYAHVTFRRFSLIHRNTSISLLSPYCIGFSIFVLAKICCYKTLVYRYPYYSKYRYRYQ
jgi:hypothetical protein